MITELVANWETFKKDIVDNLAHRQLQHDEYLEYIDLIKTVVEYTGNIGTYDGDKLDPERITAIDYGDYQGTILFVVASKGYQPGDFWYCLVDYGSCSYCDTLESVLEDAPYDYDSPEQKAEKMQKFKNGLETMCLHIVQAFKKLDNEDVA